MPTILLVDDDKHARGLLERALRLSPELRRLRLKVVHASDGEQGLTLLDSEEPDLVITDLLMPRMDGFHFCEAVRKREHGKHIGLVVTSGLYRDGKVEARVRAEFDAAFFAKPFQIVEMTRLIARLLAARASVAAAGSTPEAGARPASASASPVVGGAVFGAVAPDAVGPSAVGAGAAARPVAVDAARSAVSVGQPAGGPSPGALSVADAITEAIDAVVPGPRSGNLARTPLSRLLIELFESKATGTLELRRGGVTKRIELVFGMSGGVTSNQRHEALGPFLASRGTITEAQLQKALELAANEEKRLGETLVQMQVLSAESLLAHRTAQARYQLRNALRWPDGTFSFRPDPGLGQANGEALHTPTVVFQGLRETASPDDAALAVQHVAGRRLDWTARGQELRVPFARAFGDIVAEELDGRPSPEEMIERLGVSGVTLPALEALLLTGCIEPGEVVREAAAAPADPAAASRLRGTTDPFGLPALVAPVAPRPAEPQQPADAPAGESGLYDLLFAGEPEVDTGAAPLVVFGDAIPDDGVPDRPLDMQDSGVIDVGPFEPGDLAEAEWLVDGASGDGARDAAEDPSAAAGADWGAVVAGGAAGEGSGGQVAEVVDLPSGALRRGADLAVAAERARQAILAELVRVQGRDWYAVLGVDRAAPREAIEDAYRERTAALALEKHAGLDLGGDYAKLEELHAAFEEARATLLDPEVRAAYDLRLAGGVPGLPSRVTLAAEATFQEGVSAQAAGDLDEALVRFKEVVLVRPDQADYHAALGWALHQRAEAAFAQAADQAGAQSEDDATAVQAASDRAEAFAELDQALIIDPDHAAAHEYLGRVLAAAGADDAQAVIHLERALDARPPRLDALPALNEVQARRGEHVALARRYRKLIHLIGEADHGLAGWLWAALGAIYRDRIGDQSAARVAFRQAARCRPDSADVLRAFAELLVDDAAALDERLEVLRGCWRLDPGDATPAHALFAAAVAAERHDHAYVVASALVARDQADPDESAYYRRFRPRFVQRAGRPLDGEIWARLVHPDDDPVLEELFAVLEPVAAEVMPLTAADLTLPEDAAAVEAELSETFARVRSYAAGLLGVEPLRVLCHPDFGGQVHLGALAEPALLAGPEAFVSGEGVEVGFWVGRALSFSRPGRALGGARPSRVLKALLLGSLSLLSSSPPADEKVAAEATRVRDWLVGAPAELQQRLRGLVPKAVHGRDSVNLSRWSRALARTADRVGLVVCGDVTVAAAALIAMGADEAVDQLLDFALSPEHLWVREALALSIAA